MCRTQPHAKARRYQAQSRPVAVHKGATGWLIAHHSSLVSDGSSQLCTQVLFFPNEQPHEKTCIFINEGRGEMLQGNSGVRGQGSGVRGQGVGGSPGVARGLRPLATPGSTPLRILHGILWCYPAKKPKHKGIWGCAPIGNKR
jgi:hypothetical protein